MTFRLESTLDGACTIINNEILMKDSEAGTYGEAMVITSGRLTKCGATAAPDVILLKSTDAGTSVATNYIYVRRDQTWLADVTGSTNDAADLVPGVKVVQIDSAGTGVNADQLTGGKVIIVSTTDAATKKCRVRFDI